MNQTTMVALLPQAELIRQENKIGISCAELTVWCKDNFQAALLEKIAKEPQSVDDLKALLLRVRDGPTREEFAALILVDFILAFDKVLEK